MCGLTDGTAVEAASIVDDVLPGTSEPWARLDRRLADEDAYDPWSAYHVWQARDALRLMDGVRPRFMETVP